MSDRSRPIVLPGNNKGGCPSFNVSLKMVRRVCSGKRTIRKTVGSVRMS
jgi:hypothetical protein